VFWVDMRVSNRVKVASDLYYRLFEQFKAQGVEIPFPQRDLHLRSGVPWAELIAALSGKDGPAPGGNGKAPAEAADGEKVAAR
jgi:small-conductance mechanosensitive channel